MNLSAPFLIEFFKEPMMQCLPYMDFVFSNEDEAAKFGEVHGLEVGYISFPISSCCCLTGSLPPFFSCFLYLNLFQKTPTLFFVILFRLRLRIYVWVYLSISGFAYNRIRVLLVLQSGFPSTKKSIRIVSELLSSRKERTPL